MNSDVNITVKAALVLSPDKFRDETQSLKSRLWITSGPPLKHKNLQQNFNIMRSMSKQNNNNTKCQFVV